MVFNATFNNMSGLLIKQIGVPRENHRPVTSHWSLVGLLGSTENNRIYSQVYLYQTERGKYHGHAQVSRNGYLNTLD
jgi:hypothetical protein